nr:Chain C, EBV-peptide LPEPLPQGQLTAY [synthetic construct]1ZHL_C Chain C, EBV-peptide LPEPLPQGQLTAY [synthetic construct]2AK4_C Chain C, EBV peptide LPEPLPQGQLTAY [synthetic construct]2AK4_H Chain H, EBV peptide LPEPLPQGQLTAY [synthetic construct]2AK4_M Chain M, EBV peptide LPEPLPQGQLTAY [synthetic construct]2AK4_S Chain S, EBV peptide LPEPLPQGQLTAY [synthetic construct]3KWW_C Chain C, peptide from Trans-activator protein BZLF1 [synthetic construct]3KXF_Q Chain Q, peptide from Trans-activat
LPEPLPQGQLTAY